MQRLLRLAALTAAMTLLTSPGFAQTPQTARVTRVTVVRDAPRGDSVPVGSVRAGDVFPILGQFGLWYLVSAADIPSATWTRGWIHASFVEGSLTGQTESSRPRPAGRFMIRGFGQTGGMLFTAHNSFDTIVETAFGLFHGGGAQVVLPNGTFLQGSAERYRKRGSRALVSGDQIFLLDIPSEVTVTPVLVTVGYRVPESARYTPYVGAGLGWHSFREESLSGTAGETITKRKLGYHVVGGAEVPLARWFGVAGEVQWSTVPKALGESGVSAVFDEDDLGGTTFRLKVTFGF